MQIPSRARRLVFMLLEPSGVIGKTALERDLGPIAQLTFRRRRRPWSLPIEVPGARADFNSCLRHQFADHLSGLLHRHMRATGDVEHMAARMRSIGRQDRRTRDILNMNEVKVMVAAA